MRDPIDAINLPDVRATATTEISAMDGTALPWKESASGLEIDASAARSDPDPTVVVLKAVTCL
jgi:hypothetical protein